MLALFSIALLIAWFCASISCMVGSIARLPSPNRSFSSWNFVSTPTFVAGSKTLWPLGNLISYQSSPCTEYAAAVEGSAG